MGSSFHIENFGCRAARADGEAIANRLYTAGLREREPADADVIVVNTCSVTAEADRAARAFIRRAHRANPDARIVATGCYAQRAPQELAGMAGVVAVVGNSHKALAPEIALGLASGHDRAAMPLNFVHATTLISSSGPAPIFADERFAHSFLEEAQVTPGAQTRPNLKIQEGCGNRCSFCVIPQTRGTSRSLPSASVIRQVKNFVQAGGNELVLSGINLGRWGHDLEPVSGSPRTLAELVRQIFAQTELPRLRLSSIEPMDWDSEMIALMAEFGGTRLARHAHLPLQSGSDSVLRRMYRRYRPWHYGEKVDALLKAVGPELTLGADVMAGFPGETDTEFEETLAFVRFLPFGYLHLFPFSPRPGTRAWALNKENPVPRPVVDQRMAALRSLAGEKTSAHRKRFIGCTIDAITLQTPDALANGGRASALTENFIPVELNRCLAANRLIRVRVNGLTTDGELNGTFITSKDENLPAACAAG